jgi:hypothetical protein
MTPPLYVPKEVPLAHPAQWLHPSGLQTSYVPQPVVHLSPMAFSAYSPQVALLYLIRLLLEYPLCRG